MPAVTPCPDHLGPKLLLTISEAAYLLSVSRWTIYAMLKRGELRPVKTGADMRIPRSELDAWVDRHSRAVPHSRRTVRSA